MQVKTSTNSTTLALALAFTVELRASVYDDELATIVAANRAETDINICHTHDVCDANELMEAAFRECKLPLWADDGTMDENAVALWNSAWAIARAAEFDPARIPNPSVLLSKEFHEARDATLAARIRLGVDWVGTQAVKGGGRLPCLVIYRPKGSSIVLELAPAMSVEEYCTYVNSLTREAVRARILAETGALLTLDTPRARTDAQILQAALSQLPS